MGSRCTQTGDYALKTGSTYTGNNIHNDTIKSIYGTASDGLEIYHSGTASYIVDSGTGDLIIRASDQLKIQDTDNGENMAIFNKDGSVDLYHNNIKRLETTSGGITVTGDITFTSNMFAGDSDTINLGAGNDLQLFHNGTNSQIENSQGDLNIKSDVLRFRAANDEQYITAIANGAVELYHDNSKKLETNSGGVSVTGSLVIAGDDVRDDNYKSKWGTGDDIQIYHDGGNSWLKNTTGSLMIDTNSIYFENIVGIAEHPQHIDEIDKQMQKLVDAQEKLKELQHFKL